MSLTKIASALRRGDVVKIGKKKAVVSVNERASETASVSFLPVIDKGRLLGGREYWTSLRPDEEVSLIGTWDGDIKPGHSGYINDADGESAEGEGRMATAAKSKKSGAKKSAAKSKTNGGTKRASNEELDTLAAKVVDLRDNKGKSWGEIEETLDINPGRLRSLYNRGGGTPTRERKGSAKAAPKKSKGSTRRTSSKRKPKADPSE